MGDQRTAATSATTSAGNGSGNNSRIGIPQGQQARKSSGLRMWQGQLGHQSRSNGVNSSRTSGGGGQQQPQNQSLQQQQQQHPKQSSRSPSPGPGGRASSQPRGSIGSNPSSRLRMPSSNSNYGNEHYHHHGGQHQMASYQS